MRLHLIIKYLVGGAIKTLYLDLVKKKKIFMLQNYYKVLFQKSKKSNDSNDVIKKKVIRNQKMNYHMPIFIL